MVSCRYLASSTFSCSRCSPVAETSTTKSSAYRVVYQSPLELIPSPGSVLVIMVPVVLALGRLAGYRPPLLPNSRVLFAGLLAFFCAFSFDHLLHTGFAHWHSRVEPYGFLALIICPGQFTCQRTY